ncbi:Triosephosphate isomerase [Lipomyces oligophaga]|uniref:Triosephosphate isomerase n=1 Tax=Lipomyces oligophaga TaxID=45792 RepID=UPI0034CF4623
MARKFFVGGNFKMNGSKESIKEIVELLNKVDVPESVGTEVVISPPALYLHWAKLHLTNTAIELAAQNAYPKVSGAYTGEVSAPQIKDVGAEWVILGHSERRHIIKESDDFIAEKTVHALESDLGVILCVGETLEERESGTTIAVCTRQLDPVIAATKDWSHIVIAYEPVWAIGTGLAATPADAQETHAAIRAYLTDKIGKDQADSVRILYGGSVNGKNAKTFNDCPDIDGYLVGGASLKPEFVDIITSRS